MITCINPRITLTDLKQFIHISVAPGYHKVPAQKRLCTSDITKGRLSTTNVCRLKALYHKSASLSSGKKTSIISSEKKNT